MAEPELHAEIAFDSFVGEAFPKWYDVSPYVLTGSAKRGRSYELDRTETGEGKLSLDNADGSFTPGRKTLTAVSERFNAFGATGAGNTFTVDSGVWQHNGGTPSGGSEGVTLAATVATGGYSSVALAAVNGVPVKPGDTVTVKYSAKGPGSFQGTVGGSLGAPVVSNGQWVTQSDVYTVPAGVTSLTPEVRFSPSTAGAVTWTIGYVKVDVPHPYGGKIEPGKPLRVYLVNDDNWLHYEAVNASTADLDLPRWHTQDSTNGSGITEVTDTGISRDVFELTNTVVAGNAWFAGLKNECDYIRVKAGQLVTVSASVAVVSAGVSTTTVKVGVEFSSDNTDTTSNVAKSPGYMTVGAYGPQSVSWTSTADGYVKLGVYTDGTMVVRVADAKLTLDGKGTSTVGPISGLYPTFRGTIETWTQEFHGKLSTVAVVAVDGLAITAKPLDVPIRAGVLGWYRRYVANTASADKFFYWTGVEDPTYKSAGPTLGNLRLTSLQGQLPGTGGTFGFTNKKTMVYADGDPSGGYTIHMDPALQGGPSSRSIAGPLQLSFNGSPPLPTGYTNFFVDMWYTPEVLPPTNDNNSLFYAEHGGNTSMYVDIYGAVWWNFRAAAGAGVSCNTPSGSPGVGVIKPGIPVHLGYRVVIDRVANTQSIYGYINGQVAASNTVAGAPATIPQFTQWNFASDIGEPNSSVGNIYQYGSLCRGTINHIVLGFDTPDGFHAAAHAAGSDVAETEVSRLNRVLDAVAVSGPRIFDTAKSTLTAAQWAADTGGKELLDSSSESASGLLFVGPSGEFIYHNRHRRLGPPIRWTVKEWADGLRFQMDDTRVYNVVTAERASGLKRIARDEQSARKYGPKPITLKREVTDDNEIADAASWFLSQHAVAAPRSDTLRIEAHTLTADSDGPLRALAYGAAPSDRLLMADLPPTAPDDTYDALIEGVDVSFEWDGSVLKWTTALSVSAANNFTAFTLDDDLNGLLDSTTPALIY